MEIGVVSKDLLSKLNPDKRREDIIFTVNECDVSNLAMSEEKNTFCDENSTFNTGDEKRSLPTKSITLRIGSKKNGETVTIRDPFFVEMNEAMKKVIIKPGLSELLKREVKNRP